MLDCFRDNQHFIEYAEWYRENCSKLQGELHNYRMAFLSKKKNINRYKPSPKNTPLYVHRAINRLDRKIKNIPLLDESAKRRYFDGLNDIIKNHYKELREPRMSKKDAYCKYISTQYIVFGKHKKNCITFDEFKKAGLVNKYR